jgi:hypothetical protein
MSEAGIIKLKKKRDTQLLALKRMQKYVSSFDTSAYDRAEIEVRETLLEQVRDVFEKVQTELEDSDVDNSELSARVEFENIYLETKVRMRVIHRESTQTSNRENEVRLPKIDIPVFDGNLKAWPNFRDVFESIIHKNVNITPIQKLIYLKGSLTGEASDIIQSLPSSGANYSTAWNSIVDRYDNIQLLVSHHLHALCIDTNIKKKKFNRAT